MKHHKNCLCNRCIFNNKRHVYETWFSIVFVAISTISLGVVLLWQAAIGDRHQIKLHDHSTVPYMQLEYAEALVAKQMTKYDNCWFESVHYVMYREPSEIRLICLNNLPILGE